MFIVFLFSISMIKNRDQSMMTVNIVIISTTGDNYEKYVFFANQAEQDLNTICRHQDRNIVFNFTTVNGEDNAMTPYDIIYHHWEEDSIYLYVVGGGTSQLTAMYSFLNDNEIIVLSPDSTSVDLNIDDYVFRSSPDFLQYPPIMARFAIEYGLDKMLVIGSENYLNFEGNPFIEEYERLGGEVLGCFSYWRAVNGSIQDNYSQCLQEAQKVLEPINKEERIGVYFIGGFILEDIISESNNYQSFSNVVWLSLDAYSFPEAVLSGIGDALKNASLISAQPVTVENEKTNKIGRAHV